MPKLVGFQNKVIISTPTLMKIFLTIPTNRIAYFKYFTLGK